MRLVEYINESKENYKLDSKYYKNKYGYDKYSYLAVLLWGNLMYMTYDYLKSGKCPDFDDFEREINATLKRVKGHPPGSDVVMEELEWYCEGAGKGGIKHLTKNLYDTWMHNAETKLKKPIKIGRASDKGMNNIKPNSWISFTVKDPKTYGENVNEYYLDKGAKVIFADGIADHGEIIINSNELKKYGTEIY